MTNNPVLSDWIYLPKSKLTDREIRDLKRQLTFIPRVIDSTDIVEPVELYIEQEHQFLVPVATPASILPPDILDGLVVDLCMGHEVSFPRRPDPDHPAVRDPEAQRQLMSEMLAAADTNYCFIAQAATGTGKTASALNTIAELGRSALVIVPTNALADQWEESIINLLGASKDQIGRIQGDKVEIKDITIGIVNSLSMKDYPEDVYKSFGVVVVDECFHPDHELYVEGKGWVGVADVTDTDTVLAFDVDKGMSRFEPVSRVVSRHYDGDLHEVSSLRFKTLTTPNHEQPILFNGKPSRSTVGDLRLDSRTSFPVSCPVEGIDEELCDFDRLRIAYQADGNLLYTSKDEGRFTYRFAFRRQRKIDRLESLLLDLGIPYRKAVNGRGDTSITFTLPYKMEKDLLWFDPFVSQIRNSQFLDEIVEWDGWRNGVSCFWECKDRGLVDHVQLVASLCGKSSTVTTCSRNPRVRWSKTQVWLTANSFTKNLVPYSGEVYCVTVPSGNVVTRYKGVISVSGNCHRVGSLVFSRALPKFSARYKIGLSATPKRKDGADKVIQYHLGPIVAKSEAKPLFTKVYPINYFADREVWGSNHGSRVKCLTLDPRRNQLIVKIIKSLYTRDRQILVVSDSIDHLQKLMELSVSAGIPREIMGQFTGQRTVSRGVRKKISKEELEYVKKHSQIIYATYSMIKEGVDIPRLNAGIDATPRADAIQVVGRIRRPFPNKPRPVWYTIIDQASKPLFGYWLKRKKEYLSTNMEIVETL